MGRHARVTIERLTPYGEHFFFGYYDLEVWDLEEKRHLAHRVECADRIQSPGDEATVGYLKCGEDSSEFVSLAETKAWNFQQGSMLQWHPGHPNTKVIFNIETSVGYGATILDVEDGSAQNLDRPVASVAPDGQRALSINFARMYTFRPGYGYAGHPDPWRDVDLPADDGIYLIDLNSGKSRLFLSLHEIWQRVTDVCPPPPGRHRILVNHITWNPDSTKFLALLRYLVEEDGRWRTSVLVCDTEGNMVVPLAHGYASHYWWTGADTFLIYSEGPAGRQLYEVDLRSDRFTPVDTAVFDDDTHMRQQRRGAWIVNDTYPSSDDYRRLFLYHRDQSRAVHLARFYSPPSFAGDYRCDLHPRWSPGEERISFDSTHEGFRGIYSMALAEGKLLPAS